MFSKSNNYSAIRNVIEEYRWLEWLLKKPLCEHIPTNEVW